MRDDEARLEWYECRDCGADYTWFRVQVMDGVELYGWLHRMEEGCARDKALAMSDTRGTDE